MEEESKLKIEHEENSEHEGTFKNEEDEMEKKEVTIPAFDGVQFTYFYILLQYVEEKDYDVPTV